MTRIVVVSHNAALPFALNSAGHEVVAVDDQSDVRWSEYVAFAEVVLLDLGDAAVCRLVIDGLNASATTPIRALLLSNGSAGWDELTGNGRPGVDILPLPLTMPRLALALEALLHGPPLSHVAAQAEPARDVEVTPASIIAAAVDEGSQAGAGQAWLEPEVYPPAGALDTASDDLDEATRTMPSAIATEPVAPTAEPQRSDPEPQTVLEWVDVAAPVPGDPVNEQLPMPEAPPRAPLDGSSEDVTELDAPVVATVVREAAGELAVPHVISTVRSLTFAVGQLDTVADTAHVVLSEALQVVPAIAAALLVRDGVAWRVAAGEGLRPLEHRIRLEPDHWLVTEVSTSWHGVLISGGEGEWSQLFGAPLSARRHLLAAPQPPLGAILLLGRDDDPFSEADLQALVPLSEEGGHLLSDAVDVRRLARALRPFCDDED